MPSMQSSSISSYVLTSMHHLDTTPIMLPAFYQSRCHLVCQMASLISQVTLNMSHVVPPCPCMPDKVETLYRFDEYC